MNISEFQSVQDFKESGLYNEDQLYEIHYGRSHGLSMDQIKIYAKPEIDDSKAHCLKWLLLDKINDEIVKIIADSGINLEQLFKYSYFARENNHLPTEEFKKQFSIFLLQGN